MIAAAGTSAAVSTRVHAGQLARALGVDRDQARVRVRRAQHGGVQHARHAHVVDEAAGAGHEPLAAEARMRLADHRSPLQNVVISAATSAGRSSDHQCEQPGKQTRRAPVAFASRSPHSGPA